MKGSKEPLKMIHPKWIHQALACLTDTRNHPIHVHCNKEKHRTGTVIGCLRKLQLWTLTSIFANYRCFAGIKARIVDQQYIELDIPDPMMIEDKELPSCRVDLL
jgi:tyrosine-protein phosphatase SIW14